MTFALDATPLTVPTGGVARYTLSLTRALARRYPDDRFLLVSDQAVDSSAIEPADPSNLEWRTSQGLAGPNIGGLGNALARRWWMWGLPRFLQREHVDVFHGTDFAVPYLPLRPSVLTLHDLSPWTQAWQPDAGRVRQRTPLLLRSGIATMVITPSEAVRREAIERFRLAPDRVVATQLAASDQFRPTPVDDPAKPYFLFVGTLEPRKNLARLIEAWRVVRNAGHDVDLKIAGRTRADFHTPSPEPGLQLLGAVPDVDLPGLYSNALAVVYPSLYEGFGLPVLEAMQCGALVITSRDPAILEVTGGAEQALHVNVRTDADATRVLAQAMLEVAASLRTGSGGFREMKERALHRAEGFTWEKTAERTREVYDEARRVFSYS